MPQAIDFGVITVLVVGAAGLLVWFVITREMGPTRRMKCMMVELGLDYELAATATPGIEAVVNKARAKCKLCQDVELCELWLVGRAAPEVREDDFCPNADTFKRLARMGALKPEPGEERPSRRAR